MSALDLLIVFAVAMCLLVSFLFSGSETALTTSSRAASGVGSWRARTGASTPSWSTVSACA